MKYQIILKFDQIVLKNDQNILNTYTKTDEHLSYYDAYPSVVKGMFQQRIYRSLGLAAHLGWARLVIDRTKANIRYPTPGNSPGVADPAEDDAFENENITNPDRAFASSYL